LPATKLLLTEIKRHVRQHNSCNNNAPLLLQLTFIANTCFRFMKCSCALDKPRNKIVHWFMCYRTRAL